MILLFLPIALLKCFCRNPLKLIRGLWSAFKNRVETSKSISSMFIYFACIPKFQNCTFLPSYHVMWWLLTMQAHSWDVRLWEASSPPANKRILDFMVASQSVHLTFFWAHCLSHQRPPFSIVCWLIYIKSLMDDPYDSGIHMQHLFGKDAQMMYSMSPFRPSAQAWWFVYKFNEHTG